MEDFKMELTKPRNLLEIEKIVILEIETKLKVL